jgi:hypothetical protein
LGNGFELPPPDMAAGPSASTTAADHTVPLAGAPASGLLPEDQAALDEAERLAADCILSLEDGDEPGERDEIKIPLVKKNLPRFAVFRSKALFDMWGVSDQQDMNELVYVTTKTFAPNFENDVELRRCRIYETVTANDNVVRLTWAFFPETGGRSPNTWIDSRFKAMEFSTKQWTTMRSRKKLAQWTYRPAAKDHGEPRFSGLIPAQHLLNLKELGLLVDSKDHHFFKKVTDTE